MDVADVVYDRGVHGNGSSLGLLMGMGIAYFTGKFAHTDLLCTNYCRYVMYMLLNIIFCLIV